MDWLLVEKTVGEQNILIRFNASHAFLLSHADTVETIIFEIFPAHLYDLGAYLDSLNNVEDTLIEEMSHVENCYFLMTESGSDYRDLTFAYTTKNSEIFTAALAKLTDQFQGRIRMSFKQAGLEPYKSLIGMINR